MDIDVLKQRRIALKLSQADVARRVCELLGEGVFTQQSYAAVESGATTRSRYLPEIATVLGLGQRAAGGAGMATTANQRAILKALAKYLQSGWGAMVGYDMLAFGFDPFQHGPITESAFRLRAVEVLDGLADNNLVEN